jgi:hypothetical protein
LGEVNQLDTGDFENRFNPLYAACEYSENEAGKKTHIRSDDYIVKEIYTGILRGKPGTPGGSRSSNNIHSGFHGSRQESHETTVLLLR